MLKSAQRGVGIFKGLASHRQVCLDFQAPVEGVLEPYIELEHGRIAVGQFCAEALVALRELRALLKQSCRRADHGGMRGSPAFKPNQYVPKRQLSGLCRLARRTGAFAVHLALVGECGQAGIEALQSIKRGAVRLTGLRELLQGARNLPVDLIAVGLKALTTQLRFIQADLRGSELGAQFRVFAVGVLDLSLHLVARPFTVLNLRAQRGARLFGALHCRLCGRAFAVHVLETLCPFQDSCVRIAPTPQAQPAASHPLPRRGH